jgi:hypothetical protein
MRLQAIVNPALSGSVTPEDIYNALRDWLEKDGVKDPDKFSTDPKEIMQDQSKQMQQQLQQMQQQGQQMAEENDQLQKENIKHKADMKKQVAEHEVQDDQELMDIVGGGNGEAPQKEQKTPSESISFKDLPPEGQAQMARQAGIHLSPRIFAQHQDRQMNAQMEMKREQMAMKAKEPKGKSNEKSAE